jgi:hypothetical protein
MNKSQYVTWYDFKKDLQKEVKHSILTKEWLQIKPRAPLPWDNSFIESTLHRIYSSKN